MNSEVDPEEEDEEDEELAREGPSVTRVRRSEIVAFGARERKRRRDAAEDLMDGWEV